MTPNASTIIVIGIIVLIVVCISYLILKYLKNKDNSDTVEDIDEGRIEENNYEK